MSPPQQGRLTPEFETRPPHSTCTLIPFATVVFGSNPLDSKPTESTLNLLVSPRGGNLNDDIKEEADMGCDSYITGETSLYSIQYTWYRGINLIVGTHTHTEFPGVESLCCQLQSCTKLEFVPIREDDFEIESARFLAG
jgi:hypothetical protein